MNSKHYRSRYRVLLVEDHEPLAEATAEFIRDKGLEVQIASNGREALEMAASFHPEIVLCDMRLPDMPGYEVAQALRALPDGKCRPRRGDGTCPPSTDGTDGRGESPPSCRARTAE